MPHTLTALATASMPHTLTALATASMPHTLTALAIASMAHPVAALATLLSLQCAHLVWGWGPVQVGNLFECVLSQTFFEPCPASPSSVYRKLRATNPSPYGFLLNLGDAEYVVSIETSTHLPALLPVVASPL